MSMVLWAAGEEKSCSGLVEAGAGGLVWEDGLDSLWVASKLPFGFRSNS